MCRSKKGLQNKVREKISLHGNVPIDHVISSPDTDSVYTLPALFQEQQFAETAISRLRLNMPYPAEGEKPVPFATFVRHARRRNPQHLTIAMTGKYSTMKDSYLSITNALEHTQPAEDVQIEVRFLDTTEFDSAPAAALREQLRDVHGILVPGGYGVRGTEGMIHCIRFARERQVPYLGLCLGFQLAAIEFARSVCGVEKAAVPNLNLTRRSR